MLDMSDFQKNKKGGFTLIEMIVSLALFSIVVTIAVGALLILIGSNSRLQSEQGVLSNLTFAIDGMTREIRTGKNYYCSSSNALASQFNPASNLDAVLSTSWQDCSRANDGNRRVHGMSFVEGGDSITKGGERILYYFDRDVGKIFRRVGSSAGQAITGSDIYIKDAQFFVSGSEPLSEGINKDDQPAVTIILEASASDDPGEKVHVLQTTIVQREIDV